jgi:hypothetical protein
MPAHPIKPIPPHQAPDATSDTDEKSPEHDTAKKPDAGPPRQTSNTNLQIFQSALGIPPPADRPGLTAKNRGVYSQVLSYECRARWKYLFCNFSVTIAMFLQIIVGASVTAFGAGNSSHVLITCFGAANTALASLLAILKSQGLPNRVRQDWIGWRDLRQFIEEEERRFERAVSGKLPDAREGEEPSVYNIIKKIEEKFHEVAWTCEANRPDGYSKHDMWS